LVTGASEGIGKSFAI
jgi:short-subunit dehydrogenase